MVDEEFIVPNLYEEIMIVEEIIEECRTLLKKNCYKGIPFFKRILDRELDAIQDTLIILNHFHASARSTRTALELTVINLYRHFYPKKGLLAISFRDKYGLKSLSHIEKSPLLHLVYSGVLDYLLFQRFCESYSTLSDYVHHRVTYELEHILPKIIKSSQYYAEVLKLAVEQGNEARIVKATLIKLTLIESLDVLCSLLAINEKKSR